jgi:hypothetical protein
MVFSIRYRGFSTISIVGKHFLLSMMYKSTLWVVRKIPVLLMVFCINRDALFRRDNLFPINFFAVCPSIDPIQAGQSTARVYSLGLYIIFVGGGAEGRTVKEWGGSHLRITAKVYNDPSGVGH